jgi:hypothetical protein
MESSQTVDQPAGAAAEAGVIETRLREAAELGTELEVIVVLRGRVRPSGGKDPRRWRIRANGQRLTFPVNAVVAVTPVPKAARSTDG